MKLWKGGYIQEEGKAREGWKAGTKDSLLDLYRLKTDDR